MVKNIFSSRFSAIVLIAVLSLGGFVISKVEAASVSTAVKSSAVQTAGRVELSVERAAPVKSGSSALRIKARSRSPITDTSTPIQKVECKGDMNDDGFTNFKDINLFRTVLANSEFFRGYDNVYWKADISDDRIVDGEDINPFVALVSGSASRVCRPVGKATPSAETLVRPPHLVCVGDINADGAVNFGDISPFSSVVQGAVLVKQFMPEYYGAFMNKNVAADVDGDGDINDADSNPFVGLLSSNPPVVCPGL